MPIAFDPATGGYIAVQQEVPTPMIRVKKPQTAMQRQREAMQDLVHDSDESGDRTDAETPTPVAGPADSKSGEHPIPRTNSQVHRHHRR